MRIVGDAFSSVATHNESFFGHTLLLPYAYAVIETHVNMGSARSLGLTMVTRINRLVSSHLLEKKEAAQLWKKISMHDLDSLLLLLPEENRIIVSLHGKGSAFLRRGKVIAPLISTSGAIEGDVEKGDTIVLLNHTATSILDGEMPAFLSRDMTGQEISDAITIRLEEDKEASSGAAVLVFVVSDIVDETKGGSPRVLPGAPKIYKAQQATILERLRAGVGLVLGRNHPKLHTYGVVALVTVLFLASVVLGIRKQMNDKKVQLRESARKEAQRLFDEGISFMDAKPVESRTRFVDALHSISPFLGENLPKGKEGKALETLAAQIQDNLSIVQKIYTVSPQLFFEAEFIQKGRVIDRIAISGDVIAFFDQKEGMVAVVSATSKDAEIIDGGEEYKTALHITNTPSHVFVLTNQGIVAISPGENEGKTVVSTGDSWGNIGAIAAYAGNMYAVDQTNNAIYRFVGTENNSFGETQNYLAPEVIADFSKTTNMAIDGSIWMGSTIGKIFRYTQGRDDPFLIRGVDPPLGQHVDIWVSEEGESVFVLDRENKRVVVLSLEGVYQAQYVWKETISPTGFAISVATRKIYLLADKKLYVVSVQ